MDVTQSFAATFVDELAAQGIEYACVSPGSRSAPLAMALQRHPKTNVLMHIDERSGSFFGVGLAKATGKPVVLLCTSGTAAAEFHAAVVDFPEVVEFYRMSGEVDYLLRVVVPDIGAYDAFYKKLIARIEISKVSSAFAMEQIKYTTALPLSFAIERPERKLEKAAAGAETQRE